MAKVIRDFIYVDTERLRSLYSQVFEGIAEKIIDSFIDEVASEKSQKGKLLSGDGIIEKVKEASQRREDKILFDHLYNRLEKEIEGLLVDPNNINKENYLQKLEDTFLIKVKGKAEINDYARLSDYMSKFNEIAEAIAYAGLTEDLKEIEGKIESVTDRNEKAKLKQQLKQRVNPKKIAKDMGLSQDQKLLDNLKMFTDFFYPDGYEIIITPKNQTDIVYRGVLDKAFLRKEPEYLRTHYGGLVESEWIMVGEITFIPTENDNEDDDRTEQIELEQDEQNPSMRDPFRNVFAAARTFENMFFISKSRIEIIISPLAIYRETSY